MGRRTTGYIDALMAPLLPNDLWQIEIVGDAPRVEPIYPGAPDRHMTGMISWIKGKVNGNPFELRITGDMTLDIIPSPNIESGEGGKFTDLQITSLSADSSVIVEDNAIIPAEGKVFNVAIEGTLHGDQFSVEIKGVEVIEFSESLYDWYRKGEHGGQT